jgi:hypothetical protein
MVMGMESRTVLEYAAIKPWLFGSSVSDKLSKYFSVEAPRMIGAFIDGVMSMFLFIDVHDWPDSPVAMVGKSKRLNANLGTSIVRAATCHERFLAADRLLWLSRAGLIELIRCSFLWSGCLSGRLFSSGSRAETRERGGTGITLTPDD